MRASPHVFGASKQKKICCSCDFILIYVNTEQYTVPNNEPPSRKC